MLRSCSEENEGLANRLVRSKASNVHTTDPANKKATRGIVAFKGERRKRGALT
ncbi:hypothetical protein D3C87_2095530 [compost metagenome]